MIALPGAVDYPPLDHGSVRPGTQIQAGCI
jgi:hypothetical protein